MIKIEKKIPLGPLTTLKIGAPADFFTIVKSEVELEEAYLWAKKNKQKLLVLGGGSNTLISKPFKGLVIKNELKGLKIIKKNKSQAWVEAASGESWARFINFTVTNNLGGLENLFLIPGTVGAAPVQNIGAYGVEIKDKFESLRALDFKTGKEVILSKADCRFGYRDSIFKSKHGRYFIFSLIFKLDLKPQFKLDYGTIREELEAKGITKPTLKDVTSVIQKLRLAKIPNLAVLPNAGSFFKNPSLSLTELKKIQLKFPDIKNFPESRTRVKVPAAWLINQAGFKGKKFGRVGMYEQQPLIMVNYGGATAREALTLLKKIQTTVKNKFGVNLEPEVDII